MSLKLAIEPSGLIGTSLAVRDTATGEERTRVARESLHRVLELNGKRTEWRSLGWSGTYGFVDSDGNPLVSGKVSPGLTRTSGEIKVADDMAQDEALLAAVLTAYLLLRKADDNASAAASTVATTGSTG